MEPTGRLDCQETARFYRGIVARNVQELGFAPGLALLLGSEDPGSVLYRDLILRDCEALGIRASSVLVRNREQLLGTVDALNRDPRIHGVFVFYPLGLPGIKDDEVMDLVDPGKDIEGLHSVNIGYLNKFRKRLDGSERRCIMPCTGRAVLKVLKRGFGYGFLEGRTALVVNDSLRIGRPLTAMLANRRATPILCHRFTPPDRLESLAKLSDILISAVPDPGYRIPQEWIRDGALCLDLSHEGNFDAEALERRGIPHTDTARNSVGKVTRAMALLNLTYAAGFEG